MQPSVENPAEPASRPTLVGQLLADRYQIEEVLGEGGMGVVYRATHVQLQKSVALKVLHPHLLRVEEAVLRFEREAVASARIDHPNVVNATDFGRLPDGSFFLVLEYVAGKRLCTVIEEGPLPEQRALHIVKQIVQALAAAHAQGIIHRDLKPENVMLVEKDGDADFLRVLDFGIAKVKNPTKVGGQTLTQLGAVFGTPQYMAPEQAAGRPVDGRADLYAVGVILYEMLSGKPPFDADDLMVLLTQQMTQPPPPLPSSVSPDLAAITQRLLEKDPDARVQSATDLLVLLSDPAKPQSKIRKRALNARHRFKTWSRPFTPSKAIVAFTLLATSMTLSFFAFRPSTATAPAPSPHDMAELSTRAEQGDVNALAALEEIARGQPKATDWLAIGKARKATGKGPEALAAYSAAVKLDPQAQNDASLLSDVRDLAVDARNYEQALTFAVTELGTIGADLLMDVWLGEQGASPSARRAKKLLEDPSVRNKATPAARIALELREAQSCSAYKALLPRAKTDADTRSLNPLRRLFARSGCGFLSLSDCYACLRSNTDLDLALNAAKGRPGPEIHEQRSEVRQLEIAWAARLLGIEPSQFAAPFHPRRRWTERTRPQSSVRSE